MTWLKTTVGIDPKRAVAYLNLGDALVKLNHNAEAGEAYRKYLELAPDSKSAPDVKKKLEALPQQGVVFLPGNGLQTGQISKLPVSFWSAGCPGN